jgi:hypothetical protein
MSEGNLSQPENIADMFNDDTNQGVMDTMGELAADIAVKQASLKEVEACVKDMKKILEASKTKLAEMMIANNCKNGHKFDNGCFVKPFTQTKVFKAAGVSDEQLFEYLASHDMGDIIKPAVNWQTMNATLKEYMSLPKKKVLYDDPAKRWSKGEVGVVMPCDSEKYDYLLYFGTLKDVELPGGKKGDFRREFYFMHNEVAKAEELPEIFNVSNEQTMKFSGNGHIKFLESMKND